jgi:hypothetical protein
MRVLRSLPAPEQARLDLAASGEQAVRELAASHGVSIRPSRLPYVVGGLVVVRVLSFVMFRRRRAPV